MVWFNGSPLNPNPPRKVEAEYAKSFKGLGGILSIKGAREQRCCRTFGDTSVEALRCGGRACILRDDVDQESPLDNSILPDITDLCSVVVCIACRVRGTVQDAGCSMQHHDRSGVVVSIVSTFWNQRCLHTREENTPESRRCTRTTTAQCNQCNTHGQRYTNIHESAPEVQHGTRYCGTAALRHCGTVSLWHCVTVVLTLETDYSLEIISAGSKLHFDRLISIAIAQYNLPALLADGANRIAIITHDLSPANSVANQTAHRKGTLLVLALMLV